MSEQLIDDPFNADRPTRPRELMGSLSRNAEKLAELPRTRLEALKRDLTEYKPIRENYKVRRARVLGTIDRLLEMPTANSATA